MSLCLLSHIHWLAAMSVTGFSRNQLGGAKSVAFHHLHSNERKCYPQGLTLSNTFINDPDTGTGQSMCSASLQMMQSWEDWLIRQRVGCAAIQRDLGTLGTGTDRSLMKFNNRSAKSCPWGRITPGTRTGWGQPAGKALLSRWTPS